jgi:hypothetical protein
LISSIAQGRKKCQRAAAAGKRFTGNFRFHPDQTFTTHHQVGPNTPSRLPQPPKRFFALGLEGTVGGKIDRAK